MKLLAIKFGFGCLEMKFFAFQLWKQKNRNQVFYIKKTNFSYALMEINSLIKQVNNNNLIHKHVPRVKQIFFAITSFCFVKNKHFYALLRSDNDDERRSFDWALNKKCKQTSRKSRPTLNPKTKQRKGKITVQQK